MQMELINVQRERNQLDQQRKLFKCTAPCAPCSCNPTAAEPVSRNFQPCPPCVASLQSGVMPTKVIYKIPQLFQILNISFKIIIFCFQLSFFR